MEDLFLARLWNEIRSQMATRGVPYELGITRSPRNFFAVEEVVPYVVRVRRRNGKDMVTLTYAPARSTSVAAYEEEPG